MKIFNVYHLAPRKQTEEYSLLFSGMLVCRLTAPLCLNYLCLVHRDSHVIKQSQHIETSFTTIMGHLDLIPFVNNGLNVLLPLCISAICLAISLNLGTHILHKVGFEQFIKDDEMTLDWVQTGRDLVKREKAKMLRIYETSNVNHQAIEAPVAIVVRKSDPTGVAPNQSNAKNTFNNMDGSPASQSSSASSGLSRSSLLPRNERSGFEVTFNNTPSFAQTVDQSEPSHRFEDEIIDIDLGEKDRRTKRSNQSGGFFDDI